MRVSTCAVSGGFIHLYTALDNGLFDKYGVKLENIFIRGSAQNLTALATDEVQFTYCASDAIIPGMAAGLDVKIVASPLVKLPYVLVTRKDVRRPEDLKGKSLGIARAGDLSDRLSRAVVKKLGVPPDTVTIRPIGGSQGERYQAMAAGIVHGVIITPPLDVRAKNEGYNVMYRLIDLNIPFIYSSLHTSHKMLRERPEIVQRMVAAFAEIVYSSRKIPTRPRRPSAKPCAPRTPKHYSPPTTPTPGRSSIARWWSRQRRSPKLSRWPAKAAARSEENRKKSTTTASSTILKRAVS